MARALAMAAAMVLALAAPAWARAEERIAIPSETPGSMGEYLHHAGPAATVVGYLYLPAGAKGPVPAMILKHGSGGLEGAHGDNIRKWARLLNDWGIAAFVVDSFGPRGISGTAEDQGQLKPWADLADTFSALKVLAADPRIDPGRIGVIGWSRGGGVAMQAALETARLAVLAPTDPKFAAHVIFYGASEPQYRDRATDGAPMLFLHGEADDYVPMATTREFADWFKSMGDPVTFIGYPHAYHDFDVEGGHEGFARGVETARACDAVIDLSIGHVVRLDHKPVSGLSPSAFAAYFRSCTGTGADLGYDGAARADAIVQVRAFLAQAFHLQG
jgi:dienelactone hydrolase